MFTDSYFYSCAWSSTCQVGARIWLDELKIYDVQGNQLPEIKRPSLHVVSQSSSLGNSKLKSRS